MAVQIITAVSMTMGRGRLAHTVIGAARLTPGDRVVDIGCGPGTAVRLAAPMAAALTGIDQSPLMLGLARWISGVRRSANVSCYRARRRDCHCQTAKRAWPGRSAPSITGRTAPPASGKPGACLPRAGASSWPSGSPSQGRAGTPRTASRESRPTASPTSCQRPDSSRFGSSPAGPATGTWLSSRAGRARLADPNPAPCPSLSAARPGVKSGVASVASGGWRQSRKTWPGGTLAGCERGSRRRTVEAQVDHRGQARDCSGSRPPGRGG
jgi:hypothetical protein